MHVAIDTSPLFVTQAGVARYIRGLLSGFNERDPGNLQLSLLSWPVDSFSYIQPARALKTLYRERVWPHTTAARWLHKQQPDILHIMSGLPFDRPPSTRAVATLHDVAVLRHPERYRRWHRFAAQGRFNRLRHMERIICSSQFTADEAMALLDIPHSKLEVIHLASNFNMNTAAQMAALPDLALPAEFLLFVGSLEPGKNLALLKQTYQYAQKQGHSLPPLVIVGARWEGVEAEGPAPEDWIYAGRLPDSALVWLYRHALALVFPSKYEGFGLPILEAMALKCPVICSRLASLPEVAGNAVFYAQQTPASYMQAIVTVSNDGAARERMIAAGLQRAGTFSWARCASETEAVYTSIC